MNFLESLEKNNFLIVCCGFPSENTEEQRQFKWSLDLKDQVNKLSESKKGGYWLQDLTKEKWQGVEQKKWEELAGTKERSVYKLAFRDEWTKNEKDIKGDVRVKGALRLIKVSWEKGGCWGITDACKGRKVEVQETDKVWLIIAKGESSIYLIPVVRSSAKWGEGDKEQKMISKQDLKKISSEGVKDIEGWSTAFDGSSEWKKGRNEQLQKAFKSGFWIVRNGSFVFKNSEKIVEWKREGGKAVCYVDGQKREDGGGECRGWRNGVKLQQNAGGLIGKEESGGCKECKQAERYFPLDIAVLGAKSPIRKMEGSYWNLGQAIEIKDNILWEEINFYKYIFLTRR